MRHISVIIFLVFLSSCVNLAKDLEAKRCPEHDKRLRTICVKTQYGRGCPEIKPADAPFGRKKACLGCVVRPPRRYFALIKYCKQCRKITKEIMKEYDEQ